MPTRLIKQRYQRYAPATVAQMQAAVIQYGLLAARTPAAEGGPPVETYRLIDDSSNTLIDDSSNSLIHDGAP